MDDWINGYAKGFLELARAEGVLEAVESELYSIAETLDNAPQLRSALTDPQLPVEKKTAVIDDLLEGKASALTVSLVRLLVEHDRVGELPSIARALVETAASSRDHAVAEIRSAVPLDEQTVERLAAALGRATGKRLEVKVIVDESVVGGIVARVGDTVIDGSVANRINSLRHAVQSR